MIQKPPVPPTPPPEPSLNLCWEEWLPYFENIEASEAEKKELIETLWSIILAFVDLGWNAGNRCGNEQQSADITALLAASVLYSQHTPTQQKEEA
jgi:nitroimidazol reductase NimA-like FMN-containing flavoprotein (pyridoxamine 5'-phosphate oxidase superfamily)